MALSRRQFIRSTLALVAAPLVARAEAREPEIIAYAGADDPAAFSRFAQRESLNAVTVTVFHAQWCGPCKTLFSQLADMAGQPEQDFKVVGLDVGPRAFTTGPFRNIVAANNVIGTPTMQFFVDGDRQFSRTGLCRDPDMLARYLRDLRAALTGTGPARVFAPRCDI